MSGRQEVLRSVVDDNEGEFVLALKAKERSTNLSGCLHWAPELSGVRPEAGGVTWSGNSSCLCFWRSPLEALLWSAPEQMVCPWHQHKWQPPLPPVSELLPGCNFTGCGERKPELSKALAESEGQQRLFLPVNEASLEAARNHAANWKHWSALALPAKGWLT